MLDISTDPMNPDLHFRVLNEDDWESFFRLRLEALESEPMAFGSSSEEFQSNNTEQLRAHLSASNIGNFVLGAFLVGKMVGMAGYIRFTEQKLRHKARIWGVFVQPSHRGSGIGGALLREMLRQATSEQGLEQIILAVNSAQVAAKHLYERVGFEIYGREENALKVGQSYVDEDLMLLRMRR